MIKIVDGIEIEVNLNTPWWLLDGYAAITLAENIYVKSEKRVTESLVRHEYIHVLQQREMTCPKIINEKITAKVKFIKFLAIYLYDFITKGGYYNIRFEKEAYANDDVKDYLNNRPAFNWKNY